MLARVLPSLALAICLAAPAAAADVTLATSDGQTLVADYGAVAGATRGVVFVHQEGRKASDWRFLAERMNKAGFQTLAVDLRGHGESVPEGAERPELSEDDYRAMTADVEAAVAYLRGVGVVDVSLVGASLGANLAAIVAGRDPEIRNLVLLSPGLEVRGVSAAEAMKVYGDRPVLIAVSDNDTYAAKSALLLDSEAAGRHHLEVLTAAGHGAKMLNAAPTLESQIQGWLSGSWQTAPEPGGSTISTGDTTSVETDGIGLEGL